MSVNLFNANFYRAANPDLPNFSDALAFSHFQNYGLNEGRAFCEFADLKFYRSSNWDLAGLSNRQLFDHLQNYGVNEGRTFSPLVGVNFYRAYNSDLASFNNEQLFEHLRNWGIQEGRSFSPFVNLNIYRVANPDLTTTQPDNKKLFNHLALYGMAEGRRFSVSFDSNYYHNANPDLASLNNSQLLYHFERYGLAEARASSESFNARYYLANNADLKAAGLNNQQAQQHFEMYGFREGRLAAPSNLPVPTDPGNTLSTAFSLGILGNSRSVQQSIGSTDGNDYYHFTLSSRSNVNLALNGMSANANVKLLNSNGVVNRSSNNSGSADESISCTLDAGIYYIQVYADGNANTNYNLNLSSTPIASTANWTVMVYMAADNLESYAIQDFLEMANVGSSSSVNVVVQLDRTARTDLEINYNDTSDDDTRFGDWTDTRRGIISSGNTPGLSWGTSIGESNMGDANSLSNFLIWSMTNYQANNYALVMWGHGSGFNVSYDDNTGDSISASELSSVLGGLFRNIDLVGCDACLMGMTEFAYQIRNNASVFVGSQELIPGTGWNYTTVLSDLTSNSTMTATDLGTAIVNHYRQYYNSAEANGIEETLSAISLVSLRSNNPNNLATAISSFATTVINSATSYDRTQLDLYSFDSASFEDPNYCDLGTLLSRVASDTTMKTSIRTAAAAALNAYNSTIIQNYSSISQPGTGLSIYFQPPGTSPSSSYNSTNLAFAADTTWDEFLRWWAV